MMKMKRSTIDIAWAAGFLEGEGCFSVGRKATTVRVTANQVQKAPLEKLYELFGGSFFYIPARVSHGRNNQAQWRWDTNGQRAVEICLTIYGLMSPKRRDQIDVALRPWRTAAPRRFKNGEYCAKGHRISGSNARPCAYYGKSIYAMCRACERENNKNRHAIERLGRALAGSPQKVHVTVGVERCCAECERAFVPRKGTQIYCCKRCYGAASSKRLAGFRKLAMSSAISNFASALVPRTVTTIPASTTTG